MNKSMIITSLIALSFTGCSLLQGPSAEETSEALDTNVAAATDTTQTTETASSPSEAPEGATVYTVDTEATTLEWTGRMGPKSHVGTVMIESGEIFVDETNTVGGSFTIDMSTLATPDGDQVTTHLKSEDFFEVETYPTASFVITSVTTEGEIGEPGSYTVTGDLTIKDVTNEISFEADLAVEDQTATLTAPIVIDRSLWNVRYGSASFFDDLGDKVISDEIEFDLTLVATQE